MEHAGLKTRLTMSEVAVELRHSYSWTFANHRSIGLKGYRIGGRWYFDRCDLEAWGAAQKGTQSQLPRSSRKAKPQKGKVVFV